MKAATAWILSIIIGTLPLVTAVSRAQIQSWIDACDLSEQESENCRRYTCLRALKRLVHPETRVAYEQLGMGAQSNLNDYIRLHDYCRLHSQHVTAMKPVIVTHNWTTNLLALKTYRGIHGDMLIPQSFVVPTDDQSWPIETHGMKLGLIVNNLRRRKTSLSQNRLDALDELGFEWKASLDEKWEKNLLALTRYKEIHGHVRVPQSFVVPTDDQRWPIEMHGMKLGIVVKYNRQRRASLSENQLNALETLGFEWKLSLDSNLIKTLLALSQYKEIYGHVRVPQRFVVPTGDQRWPIELHGMKLGIAVKYIRQRRVSLSANQLDALDELGFEWNLSVDENWKKTLLALKTFRDIHGHVRVPKLFIVSTDDKRWPIKTHGMKLGKVTSYLRQNKISLSQNRIDALEAIGFKWGVRVRKTGENF
jgi:hypothetical protein